MISVGFLYVVIAIISSFSRLQPIATAQSVANTGTGEIAALKILKLAEANMAHWHRASREHNNDASESAAKYPYVTVSYAQTIDGSIAPVDKSRLDISSKTSFKLLHSLRNCHDGVMIGVSTLLADKPRLNVREVLPGVHRQHAKDSEVEFKQPSPIVLDSDLKIVDIPEHDLLLRDPVILTCLDVADERFGRAERLLRRIGGQLVTCSRDNRGRCDINDSLLKLQRLGIRSVLVEGGAAIIQSVMETKLFHQAVVTVRPCFLGGFRAMTGQLTGGPLMLHSTKAASIGGDLVVLGQVALDSDGKCGSEESPNGTCIGGVYDRIPIDIVSTAESDSDSNINSDVET